MKKEWFTLAFFDERNQPHHAHAVNNFIRIEVAENQMLDLIVESALGGGFMGAKFAAIWPGKLSEQTALYDHHYPTFYVYASGLVERIAPKEPNLYRMAKRKESRTEQYEPKPRGRSLPALSTSTKPGFFPSGEK